MKMAAWVTVEATGATKVLAYSFLLDESVESFLWACECFKDAFRVAPAVIFTDSDLAMKAAIAAAFADAKHLLCVWHLSKNMFTHIKAACGNNTALWKRMVSAWWLITKQTDASSRATFDAEWAALAAMLSESTVTGKSMESARAWLDKMAEERERWAYRWTWRLFTMGIHSTQRIESLHSHIMGYLRASTLLVHLLEKLELHSTTVESRALTRDHRLIAYEESAAKANHPFLNALKELIHPFPLSLVKAQLVQSSYFNVASTAEGIYTVSHMSAGAGTSQPDVVADGDDADVGVDSSSFYSGSRTCTLGPAGWSCSCQFTICYGLPCRHILRICEVKQIEVPSLVQLCSPRWRYRNPEQVRHQVEALRLRNPAPRSAPAQTLSRDDRFGLLISACRAVAELGAADATLYNLAREGVDALVARLRSGSAPERRGGGPAPLDVVAERGLEQCRGCWEFGHRKSSSRCPRYKMPPLPKPDALARGPAVTLVPRRLAPRRGRGAVDSDDEEEMEEEAEEDDSHENVCHGCSSTGELFCCASCRHAYCSDCLPLAARFGLERDDWRCPVCTGTYNGGAVGNPQTGRRQACGKERARKRGPGDPTRAAGKAIKRAKYAGAKNKSGAAPKRFR